MPMSIPELQRSLRALRLSGMSATLEARALQVAAREIDFLEAFSWLVQDELDRRRSRLPERRFTLSGLPERKDPQGLRLDLQPQAPQARHPRARDAQVHRARRRRPADRPARHRQEPRRQGHRASAPSQRGYKVFYREAHVLIEEIHEARELGELRKYRAQIAAADLLVIDDLFLRKLPAERRRRTRRCAHESLRKILDDHHIESTQSMTGARCSATSSSSPRSSIA